MHLRKLRRQGYLVLLAHLDRSPMQDKRTPPAFVPLFFLPQAERRGNTPAPATSSDVDLFGAVTRAAYWCGCCDCRRAGLLDPGFKTGPQKKTPRKTRDLPQNRRARCHAQHLGLYEKRGPIHCPDCARVDIRPGKSDCLKRIPGQTARDLPVARF